MAHRQHTEFCTRAPAAHRWGTRRGMALNWNHLSVSRLCSWRATTNSFTITVRMRHLLRRRCAPLQCPILRASCMFRRSAVFTSDYSMWLALARNTAIQSMISLRASCRSPARSFLAQRCPHTPWRATLPRAPAVVGSFQAEPKRSSARWSNIVLPPIAVSAASSSPACPKRQNKMRTCRVQVVPCLFAAT